MRVITLIPLTKRARQVIQEHGERWEVVKLENKVLFSDSPGPWLLVQPLSEERAVATTVAEAKAESASRWVHEFNETQFKVAP